MEAFLTTILFIFIGFWLFGRIGRLFLRWWIPKKQREFYEQFGGAGNGGNNRRQQQRKEEGEVTITNQETPNEHHINKNIGDYVDYEEVKGSK